jgi:hypothetical protein
VLALLDPSSGLKRVVMEDLEPIPPDGVDPELLLGVDLSEFYEGFDLSSASRVVVSQLKHSHRHPDRPWTAARLSAPNSRGGKAVITRLADLYTGIAATGTRDEVLGRLEIRLVSNMRCADVLTGAVAAAQRWLAERPGRVSLAALLKTLDQRASKQIERLSGGSGLGSLAFTDFLRVLDLSYTGVESRAEQELRVTKALSEHVMADLGHASLALTDLVRKRALPDGEGIPIERSDVLAALEVHSEFDLLPTPPRFEPPSHWVRTPDARRIATALGKADDRRVLAHGAAGVGKTTTILDLERELPPGSVVLAYDCFGDGDYETPGAGRHLPVRFALHLCNELAARCKLPLLVRPSSSVHDLWRELARRVETVARLLAEEGSQLVIVVDAADNSSRAGRHFNEDTFLRRLWSQPIPEGAGLVVTCRTGRRDVVAAPPKVAQVVLAGFDDAASADYLRQRFPDASEDEARAFHINSKGNPRIQFYALFEKRAGAATTLDEAIEQAKLTPDGLFESLLEAAVAQAPHAAAARDHMAELVCLTKPLTTSRFRAISGMAAARVRAFCDSLVPGVLIEDGVIAFRDEDFANFLRTHVGETEEANAHSRLANLFLAQSDDAYAAEVVADHLHNAGRGDDLVELALQGAPEAIVDGLARQQVYRRRLALALQHAADIEDRAAACRLVILAGEAARQSHAVTEILRRRPDLGMRYSDPEAVMRVYTSAENLDWQGPIRMQLAALYARMGDDERAREEGRAAHAWLLRRQEADDRWPIEADDVGAYAEAWFYVHGGDAAEGQLRLWRPPQFALGTAVALVRKLALNVPGEELGDLIATRDLPMTIRARLLASAFAAGAVPAAASVRAVVTDLLQETPVLESADGWWAATFSELAAYVGVARKLVRRLTKALQLPQPRSAPDRYERLGRYRDPLRLAALRAATEGRTLEIDELMPASVTDPADASRAHYEVGAEQRNMHENVGRYLNVFASRARMLMARPPVAGLRAEWEGHFERNEREQSNYRRESNFGYRMWLAAFTDALLACEGTDVDLIAKAADLAEEAAGSGAYACWMAVARRLTRDARYRLEGLKLLERAASAIEAADWPASEKADSLLDACAIADPVDEELARDIHARAIRAAEGMDDDAIGRLELHARVAATASGTSDAASLAWRMAQALAAHRNRVSDTDHLPWQETLRAAALLHPQTALALVSRFEDDGYMRLSEAVPTVVCPLVDAGFLKPEQALPLLGLAGERVAASRVTVDLLERIPKGPDRSAALAEVSLRIRRDLLPETRPGAADMFVRWAEDQGFANAEAVQAVRSYRSSPARDHREEMSRPRRVSAGESDWERRERQADDVLARADVADASTVDQDLAELAQLYGAERIGQYLARAAKGVTPSKRGAFVDALGAIGVDHPVARFHADDVLEALVQAAKQWGGSQPLRKRIASAIGRTVETHLGPSRGNRGLSPQVVDQVLQLDVTNDPSGVVLRAIGGSLEQLDAPLLFATASLLARELLLEDRAALLSWSLEGLESQATPVPVPELPVGRDEVLASMLWSLFGAPDKATRWRAAHVTRAMVAKGHEGLGYSLFNRASLRDAGPFASDSLPFHWLSAQVWTLMVLARVASDRPERVRGLASELASFACDEEWPHAGVREFARRGALHLAAALPGVLTTAQTEDLKLANMPRACKRERADYFSRTGSGNRDYDTERCHFDSMDTIPYVYGPFGARFGLDVDEVCERAERWIIDRLGLSDTHRADPRLEAMDYSQRDNHHGTSPRGESWKQMLEEHALQLVAGELCDQGVPIEAESYDEPQDPWTTWLASWVDALDYGWLVDEREPVPPVGPLLLYDVGRDDWPELTDADLWRAIGADAQDTLVVDASVDFSPGFGWGSTYVTSALVSPDTAPALVRAFMAAEDPYRFGLPLEQGYAGWSQDDIDFEAFRLKGWIWETSSEQVGLEEHDPLRRIALDVTRPGTRFVEICRGRLERDGRVIRGPGGSPIAWQRAWSDLDTVGDARRDPRGTKGVETYVRRDMLCEFLRETGAQLVIKAVASRHKSKRDYLSDEEEPHEQRIQRVYRFCPDAGLMG